MAFTFSTEALQRPLADFGNDAAAMILQTGQTIQQGLQQMMTNRQVAGLGRELGTINPESPDWAQQAIKLGSRYPLAMKSPAGQFMLSTQAKAHAEWSQTQRATAQADVMMKRQIGMENLRTQNDLSIEGVRQKNRIALAQERGDAGVDLLGAQPVQRNPAQGIPFGTDETQPAPMEEVAGTPLTGMDGLLPDISGRALSPLRAAQQATGVKPSRAQVFSAIAQEDRQMQQEAMATEKASKDAAKAVESEKRSLRGMEAVGIRQQRTNVNSQLMAAKRKLESDFDEEMEVVDAEKPLSKEQTLYFRRRKALSDEIQALTADYAELTKQLEALGGSEENVSRRKYDPATRSLR